MQGTTADYTQVSCLISGLSAQYLLANKGYDSNEMINQVKENGMEIIIPRKKIVKRRRSMTKELYKLRHLIENAFLFLKR